jgi:protein-tyrosine phosphatase
MDSRFSPSKVEEGLWFGGAPSTEQDYIYLKHLGVTHIIVLQPREESMLTCLRPEVSFAISSSLGMVETRLPIEDLNPKDLRAKIKEYASYLVDLRARGASCFVHCAYGINRSPTLVAAYLALSRGLAPEDACALVQEVSPSSKPDEEAVRVATSGRSPRF